MLRKRLLRLLAITLITAFLVAVYLPGGCPAGSVFSAVSEAGQDEVYYVGRDTDDADEDRERDDDEGVDKEEDADNEEDAGDREDADEEEDLDLDLDEEDEEIDDEELSEIQEELAEALDRIAKDPVDISAYEDLAEAYASLGQWDLVVETANQMLALEAGNDDAIILLAAGLYQQGNQEEGMQVLLALAEQESNNGDLYEVIGELEKLRGKLHEALEAFEKAAAVDPEDDDIYEQLGEVYEELGMEGVKVFVDGKRLELDVEPKIVEGYTLVPFRTLAESLDAEVSWDPINREVVVKRNDILIRLVVDSTDAEVNGRAVVLEVAASVIKGRVMVPLRFISEGLDSEVTYQPVGQLVVVN
ncbi:MAG: stalk domain-containing protein [Bacillota bacterium]